MSSLNQSAAAIQLANNNIVDNNNVVPSAAEIGEAFDGIARRVARIKEIVWNCTSTWILKKKVQEGQDNIQIHPELTWNSNEFEYLDFDVIELVQPPEKEKKEDISMRLSFWEQEKVAGEKEPVYYIQVKFRRLVNEEGEYVTQVCEYMIYMHPQVGSHNLEHGISFDAKGNTYRLWASSIEDVVESPRGLGNDLDLVKDTITRFGHYIAALREASRQDEMQRNL